MGEPYPPGYHNLPDTTPPTPIAYPQMPYPLDTPLKGPGTRDTLPPERTLDHQSPGRNTTGTTET